MKEKLSIKKVRFSLAKKKYNYSLIFKQITKESW